MDGKNFSSTPPLTPPTTEDQCASWLRLIRSRRVGTATFFRLMREHGSAEAALAALPLIAADAGVQKYQVFSAEAAQAEMTTGRRFGATLLCYGMPAYPRALMDIEDAPPVIWAIGQLDLLNQSTLAMVGARNASSLGTRMAKRLASDLGTAGHVIASGLARGIDRAAHEAALPTGTIAVVAGGIDVTYPKENTELAAQIRKEGVMLSEAPMGLQPAAQHFPRRNRIISGLSQGVIVVEATAKSGSLITARDAADQGRDVYAVPGHPFDSRASGCNLLLRDGATLVRGAKDVLEALPRPEMPEPSPQAETGIEEAEAGDVAAGILALLSTTAIPEDQLIRDLGLAPQTVTPVLLTLELDGKVSRAPGGMIQRVPEPI